MNAPREDSIAKGLNVSLFTSLVDLKLFFVVCCLFVVKCYILIVVWKSLKYRIYNWLDMVWMYRVPYGSWKAWPIMKCLLCLLYICLPTKGTVSFRLIMFSGTGINNINWRTKNEGPLSVFEICLAILGMVRWYTSQKQLLETTLLKCTQSYKYESKYVIYVCNVI